MARGGKRPGSGRKKGSTLPATRERRALAAALAEDGVTPLHIITTTMRDLWEDANKGPVPNLSKRMQAVALAEKAAPYLHPRLASTALTGADGGPVQFATIDATKLSDAALKELTRVCGPEVLGS